VAAAAAGFARVCIVRSGGHGGRTGHWSVSVGVSNLTVFGLSSSRYRLYSGIERACKKVVVWMMKVWNDGHKQWIVDKQPDRQLTD